MERFSIIAILVLSSLQIYSQKLNGLVLDVSSKKPVSNVSVFFNGSTIGTITDYKGHFELRIPDNQKLPVAVSALGYDPVLVKEYTSDNLLQILLVPKVYELDEVVISSKRSWAERAVRNQNLSTFKRQFLGETTNAYKCKILNESEIVFRYDNKTLTLTATSANPLIISNKSLGYVIRFYLEGFKFSQDPYFLTYTGNYIFSEDSSLNQKERERAGKRRRLAYLGSRMHLMRSIWDNTIDSAGFVIKDPENKVLRYDDLVLNRNSTDKYLGPKGSYRTSFYSRITTSAIKILEDSVFFNKLGYFDPYHIQWTGEMSKQRVADLLPFDYVLK